jgi:formylglycine-generating enzyme
MKSYPLMAAKTSPPASAFKKVLRAFETGGFTCEDVLAELNRLLKSGASPAELLEIVRRRGFVEPLPVDAHMQILRVLDGAMQLAAVEEKTASAEAESTGAAASAAPAAKPAPAPGPSAPLRHSDPVLTPVSKWTAIPSWVPAAPSDMKTEAQDSPPSIARTSAASATSPSSDASQEEVIAPEPFTTTSGDTPARSTTPVFTARRRPEPEVIRPSEEAAATSPVPPLPTPSADASPKRPPAEEKSAFSPTEAPTPALSSAPVQAAPVDPSIAEVGPPVFARIAEPKRNFFSRVARALRFGGAPVTDAASAESEGVAPAEEPVPGTAETSVLSPTDSVTVSTLPVDALPEEGPVAAAVDLPTHARTPIPTPAPAAPSADAPPATPILRSEPVQAAITEPGIAEVGPSVSARMAEATRTFFCGVTRARAPARTIPDSVPAKAETISLAEAPHAPSADASPEQRPAQEEPAVGPTEVVSPILRSEPVQAASTEPRIAEVGPSVSARMAEATRTFFSRTRRLRASVRTQLPDSVPAKAETISLIDAPQEETSAVAAVDASEAASFSPTQAPTPISDSAVGAAAAAGASDLGGSETGPSIRARLSKAIRNFLDVLSRALRSARPPVPDSAPAKTELTSLGDAPQEEMPFASSLAAPAQTPTPTLSSTPAPTPAPPPTVPPADASPKQRPAEEATYFVDVLRALLSARTQLDSTPAKTETTWPTDAPREEAPVAPSATPAQAPAPIFTAPDQVQKRAASPTPAAAALSAGIPPAGEAAGPAEAVKPAEAIKSALNKLDWPDNVTISWEEHTQNRLMGDSLMNRGASQAGPMARIFGLAAALLIIVGVVALAWFSGHHASSPTAATAVSGAVMSPGSLIRDCPTCAAVALLPAGRFKQGAATADAGSLSYERPQHWVIIGRPLAMSMNLVTVDEFRQFVDATRRDMQGCDTYDGAWKHRPENNWQNPGFNQTGAHPVTCVSWNDANAYAQWLSTKTGHRYRLPSASEWEYAARAGSAAGYPWAANGADACAYANVADVSAAHRYPGWLAFACNDGYVNTSPVGSFKANSWGLNDMLGNVFQWTEDCWHADYRGAPVDGSARTDGDCSERELRGGSWFTSPTYVRADYRNHFAADYRTSSAGIRLVRDLAP